MNKHICPEPLKDEFMEDFTEFANAVAHTNYHLSKRITDILIQSFKKNIYRIKKMKFNYFESIQPAMPLVMEIYNNTKHIDPENITETDFSELYKYIIKTSNKYKKSKDKASLNSMYKNEFMNEFENKISIYNEYCTIQKFLTKEDIDARLIVMFPLTLIELCKTDFDKFTRLIEVINNCYEDINDYLLFTLGIIYELINNSLIEDGNSLFVDLLPMYDLIIYISSVYISNNINKNNCKIEKQECTPTSDENIISNNFDNLNIQLNDLKSVVENFPIILKNCISQNYKDLENLKFNTLESTYKNSINVLKDKIIAQSITINDKNSTIKDLKQELNNSKKTIDELRKKINSLELLESEDNEIINVEEPIEEEAANQLGYIINRNDSYFLRTSTNKEFLIDTSNHVLFTLNQFAQINKYCMITKTYNYIYNTPLNNFTDYEFIVTNSKNDKIAGYIPRLNKSLDINCNSYKLGINQVALLGKETNKVETVYKRLPFTVENYQDYLDEFINNVYLVISHFADKYIVRNIFTNEEFIKEFSNKDFDDYSIIFEFKDGYIQNTSNISFYVNSALYKNSKIVTAIIIDNHVGYKHDVTNKINYINNIPENKTIFEGEAIKIDEFNNFIDKVATEVNSDLIKERKKIVIKKEKPSLNRDIIEYNIAVVGDIGLQHSYKTAGLKNKMNIDTIDGSLSYSKIRLNLKGYDLILIDPSCIEHDNMYAIRDLYDNVLFIKSNGSNRIIEYIKDYFDNKNEK